MRGPTRWERFLYKLREWRCWHLNIHSWSEAHFHDGRHECRGCWDCERRECQRRGWVS